MTHWTPHPELLVSKTAAGYLSRKPDAVLTKKQVCKAVQLAHDTKGLVPDSLTVAQLRVLFTGPPDWLLDHHRALVAKGVASARYEVVLEDAEQVQREAAPAPCPQPPTPSPRQPREPERPSLIPVFREPVA